MKFHVFGIHVDNEMHTFSKAKILVELNNQLHVAFKKTQIVITEYKYSNIIK